MKKTQKKQNCLNEKDWEFPFLENMILDKRSKKTQKKPIFAEKTQNEQITEKGGNRE